MNNDSFDGYRGSAAQQQTFFAGDGVYDPAYGFRVFLGEDGYVWSPNTSAEVLRQVEQYEFDASDATAVGYPKSGTNWLQIMIANLYDDWGTTAVAHNRTVPHLEIPNAPSFEGFECTLAARHPRLTKSHLPANRMPRSFRERNVSKVVYICRNPKDSCLSYFHELRAFTSMEFSLSLDDWVQSFVAGRVPNGSWLDHTLGWHARKESVLHLKYEEVRTDPAATLARIADFIGRPVAEERIAYVARETNFETMKNGELRKQLNIGEHDHSISPFMRSGKVGGWRSTLTDAHSRAIDAAFGPALKAAGISFTEM